MKQGRASNQVESNIETEASTGEEPETIREYRQNASKFEAFSESALESETIPLGHRQTIRRHFEMIRPNGNEGEPVPDK